MAGSRAGARNIPEEPGASYSSIKKGCAKKKKEKRKPKMMWGGGHVKRTQGPPERTPMAELEQFEQKISSIGL